MENLTVIEVDRSNETVGMGESKTVGLCSNYENNIEILFEDDSFLLIKKTNIQSIIADDNNIRLDLIDGSYYLFELN